ncbi:DUF805 domain-containing protein [Flavobacterium sp.]|uniref:DUF805 domain-containing protein n=1 Tax=Flavobacterium sp. TaxID=239 RepID=UPI003F69816A
MKKSEENYNLLDWWKKVVIDNYANFNGRARRKEYWYFVLVNIIISILLGILDGIGGLFIGDPENGNGILGSISSIVFLIPSIAVGVRRMHDNGKSGWYLLIPIYNFVLAVSEGENQKNEYGNNPKAPMHEINEIGTSEE